jgi:hypothetical protein
MPFSLSYILIPPLLSHVAGFRRYPRKHGGAGLVLHPHALRGLALVGGALVLGMNALSFHSVVFLTLCFFFAGNSGLNYSRSDLDYDGWISYVNNFP